MTRIATQGSFSVDKWVKSYTIDYSLDGGHFDAYSRTFEGNSDRRSISGMDLWRLINKMCITYIFVAKYCVDQCIGGLILRKTDSLLSKSSVAEMTSYRYHFLSVQSSPSLTGPVPNLLNVQIPDLFLLEQ